MTEENSTFFKDFYAVEILLKQILLPWNSAWELLSNPGNPLKNHPFIPWLKKIKVIFSYDYKTISEQLKALQARIMLNPEMRPNLIDLWEDLSIQATRNYEISSEQTQDRFQPKILSKLYGLII